MELSIIEYTPTAAGTRRAGSVEELLSARQPGSITWINLEGSGEGEPAKAAILKLAEAFAIHPLTVEDILDFEQRPKAEEFDGYLYLTFKAVNRRYETEQLSLVLLPDTVLTFQQLPGDSFDGIRKRILNNGGRVRRMGADYLAYAILDATVDAYLTRLDELGGGIEDFEDRALDERDEGFTPDLQGMKKRLLQARRTIGPLRESLSLLLHGASPLLRDDTMPFFKDVHDALVQAGETVETYREHLAGVMEIRLSMMSYRMNSVMKVLTIISTIFIPLSFIVGVYGMNFKNMPELDLPYAYPVTWGVMLLIVAGMLVFFKKRRWL